MFGRFPPHPRGTGSALGWGKLVGSWRLQAASEFAVTADASVVRPGEQSAAMLRLGGAVPVAPGINRAAWLPILAAAFALLLLARQPDVLLHPTFWGEDGWLWYPEAYQAGWYALHWPASGYYQTFSLVIANLVQPFPLVWAPALFAAVALLVQVSPAIFLLTSRMDRIWPSFRGRLLFALAFLTLQHSGEVYVDLTNAQWWLSLLAFLVLVGDRPRSALGFGFDALVLVLSGLSGPFCFFLLPIALWRAAEDRRNAVLWLRVAIVLAAAWVQAHALIASGQEHRSTVALGASLAGFARILSLQIVGGAMFGQHSLETVVKSEWWWSGNVVPLAASAAALAIGAIAVVRGPPLIRKAALFALLIFAAALVKPNASANPADLQWPALGFPPIGVRYWIIPMLVWIAMLFVLAADRNLALRALGYVLLSIIALEIPGDWTPRPVHAWIARGFDEAAVRFAAAPAGSRVKFPIEPAGSPPMVLIKR